MLNRARRALLFMPGDDRRKIEKGASLDVDSIIMDLEDGVAYNRKEQARVVVRQALAEVDFGHTERLVRINPVTDESSTWFYDINETIEAKPDGYVIPKVENAEQVQRVAEHITRAERKYGWKDGQISVLAIVETAMGIVYLRDIAESDPRLVALIFGAEDLVGDIGAVRSVEGAEVAYSKSKLVLFAKAYRLQAVDTPFVDLTASDEILSASTREALNLGYTGRLAIHPKQIEPIQRVYTPTQDQIRDAKGLISAFDAQQSHGKGVFAYEGRMVDMPMIKAAQAILNRASAAGIDLDSIEVS
jgi:citrate lyase beta subunit